MIHRITKALSFTLILLLFVSLVGCSFTASSKKEDVSHQAKTTEVTKGKSEQTSGDKTIISKKAAASAKTKTEKGQGVSDSTKKARNQKDHPSSTAKQTQTNTGTKSATQSIAKSTTKPAAKSAAKQAEKPATTTASHSSSAAKRTTAASTSHAAVKTVNITIVGPKDKGMLLKKKSVKINAGDTVLDVLLAAVGTNNVDYSGSGASAYVRGIDNIYEFDYGQTSGWNYKRNGIMTQKSCGVVKVNAGDTIEWIYKEN